MLAETNTPNESMDGRTSIPSDEIFEPLSPEARVGFSAIMEENEEVILMDDVLKVAKGPERNFGCTQTDGNAPNTSNSQKALSTEEIAELSIHGKDLFDPLDKESNNSNGPDGTEGDGIAGRNVKEVDISDS